MIVGKRKIKDGSQFNYLFPKAKGGIEKVKKSARLGDTIQLMKKVVKTTHWQTKKLAEFLKSDTLIQTCRNIWEFAHNYFQYEIDTIGIEQIRTPARSWHDRISGIDCDCFSTLIGATLYRLKIPFIWRLTKYKSTEFEHVYPVALIGNKQVIMDAVIDEFNYEVPYAAKKDIIMELHTLNGISPRSILDEVESEKEAFSTDLSIDAVDLFGDELNGLDGRKEREARRARRKQKREEKGSFKDRLKEGIKKGVNKLNKVNPATVLLRAGVLAAMKLNLFKLASKLRFAYWSTEEARRQNMDLNKFNQLQRIREKMEKIFFKAGGKPKDLKRAIISGKGNRNRMVQLNGLGAIVEMPSDEDDLRSILGNDLYSSDFEDESINGLGAIATGAAITAASGVLATISRLVKKLGGLFKRGTMQAQQEQIQEQTDNEEDKHRKFSVRNIFNKLKQKTQQRRERKRAEGELDLDNRLPESEVELSEDSIPEEEFLPDQIDNKSIEQVELEEEISTANQSDETQAEPEPNKSEEDQDEGNFWSKNWKWMVPVGGTLLIGGTALGIRAYRKKKAKKEQDNKAVNGLGAIKKTGTKNTTKRKKNISKKAIPKPYKKRNSKSKQSIRAVELIP